jgi:hypothetical protein
MELEIKKREAELAAMEGRNGPMEGRRPAEASFARPQFGRTVVPDRAIAAAPSPFRSPKPAPNGYQGAPRSGHGAPRAAVIRPAEDVPRPYGDSGAKRQRYERFPKPVGLAPYHAPPPGHSAVRPATQAVFPGHRSYSQGAAHRNPQAPAGLAPQGYTAIRPAAPPPPLTDHVLKRLTTMRQRIESGVLTKSVLSQWAGDLMYDLFAHAPPSEAARQQLEYVFTCLYDRLKADFDGNRKADWEPLGQDVKAFFEAGFRVRKHVRPAAQQTIFLRYVDVLNLFLALPAEPPADLESIPGCWLRPTLALAAGMRPGNFQLQDHIVPESLAPSDLLVDLFWDLEVDLFCRSPEDPVDEITAVRRKRGATKVALSILQNCDFSTMRPDESGKKSPPVVVICHAKSMVLKLADTLNHLARYEYASGYRGAEAAYRDTEGLSTMAVSILVCTPGRMLNELSSGGLSMANTKLLAFTFQGGPSLPEYGKVRTHAPATARVMLFQSTKSPAKGAGAAFAQVLKNTPVRLFWEGSDKDPFRVEEYRPSSIIPLAKPKESKGAPALKIPAVVPTTPGCDFGVAELNTAIPPVLSQHRIANATAAQKVIVPEMMTGENRVFQTASGSGTVLGFVVPTVHLSLNYPPEEPRTRVLVLTTRIDDVDRIVGEYLRFVHALPETGLTAEGLHSQRLSGYETPFNCNASVIVATPQKLANILLSRDKNVQLPLDLSAVDVVVLYKLTNAAELREVGEIHQNIVATRGAVQVVAFLTPTSPMADQLSALCPNAPVMPAP